MINVFNSNYEEIGSLDKNLALHTLGKVKIRYGRKYIDLLNDKGELNVSIPKIIQKKDSLEDISKDGFYIVDGNLYAYKDGDLYQLTGVEGDYISFSIEQNLTQEQIDIAQNNIGLEFKNISKAKQTINKGIVFIDDRIFYIDGDNVKELTLKEPLSSINDQTMGPPSSDNVAIVYKDEKWQYINILTKDDLDKLKPTEYEEDEEDEDVIDIFDPIQYSKVYTIKTAQIYGTNVETYLDQLETIPVMSQQQNDLAILSIPAEKVVNVKNISYDGSQSFLLGLESEEETVDGSIRYNIKQKYDVLTFNLIYKNNKFQFCDKDGTLISLTLGKGFITSQQVINNNLNVHPEDLETVVYIKISNDYWVIRDLNLKKRHIYIKAEEPNHQKFKIDYKNAQIALEENTPKIGNEELKIVPHTVLGDLDDTDKYYNNSTPFRTYTEKQSKQGLYSDQAVFSGAEFRGQWPEEVTNNELVQNFPRYSKKLNTDLCTNHPGNSINIENANDLWRQVIPTIEWIKRNGAMLNRPLKDINEENRTNLPENPTSQIANNIQAYTYRGTDSVPIAIVFKNGHWTYEPVVPFSWFLNCCGFPEVVEAPIISGESEFTDSTTVTITCATTGATIYYTTNGTDPTSNSTQYTTPITLNNTTTIKAIAYKDNESSLITTKQFTKTIAKVNPIIYYVQNQNGTDVEVLNLTNLNSYTSTFNENLTNLKFRITTPTGYTALTRSDFEFTLSPTNSGFELLTASGTKGNISFPGTNGNYQAALTVTFNGNSEYNSLTKQWPLTINMYESLYTYYLKFYMYPNADSNDIGNELIKDSNNNPILIGVIDGQITDFGNLSNPTINTYRDYSGTEYNGRVKTIRSGRTLTEFGYNFNFPIAYWEDSSVWPYPEAAPYECIKFKHWMYGYGDVNNTNTFNPQSNARDRVIDLQLTNWGSLNTYTYNDSNNNGQKTLNLFAIWEPIYYIITWDLNGGDLSTKSSNKISENPYRLSFTVQKQNNNTIIFESIGIKNTYPRWKFDTPIKENAVFAGWSPDYSSTKLTSNVTLTAQWNPILIRSSLSSIPTEGGTTTISYWIDGYTTQAQYTDNIYLSGNYSSISSLQKVGNPTFSNGKWNQTVRIGQKSDTNEGIINFIANYKNIQSKTLTVRQNPTGTLTLPDFDFMVFNFSIVNPGDKDLDVGLVIDGSNKTLQDGQTKLDKYYLGAYGAEGANEKSYSYEVYKNITRIFNRNGDEILYDSVDKHFKDSNGSLYDPNTGTTYDTRKDYLLGYSYVIYSGDQTASSTTGTEQICVNWYNIRNGFQPTDTQKSLAIYIGTKFYNKGNETSPKYKFNYTFLKQINNSSGYLYKASGDTIFIQQPNNSFSVVDSGNFNGKEFTASIIPVSTGSGFSTTTISSSDMMQTVNNEKQIIKSNIAFTIKYTDGDTNPILYIGYQPINYAEAGTDGTFDWSN